MFTGIKKHFPIYAAALSLLATCPATSGQGLAMDTPSEIERARAKAEKAWSAWEAMGRIESRLFTMAPERALAAIQRDGQLADEYLTARQQQLKLLSQGFRQHAEALEAATATRPDIAKLREGEERNLTGLLEGDLSTKDAMEAADRDRDPARRAARRQALARESEEYKGLQEDARKRLELLRLSQQSAEKFDRNEQALVDTLRHLADSLQAQAAAFEQEREMWRTYHKDLEHLVLQNRPGVEGSEDRPGASGKSNKPANSK
jgi:hypothetical protein